MLLGRLLVTAVVCSAVALAQGGMGGGGGMGGMGGGGGMGGMGGGGRGNTDGMNTTTGGMPRAQRQSRFDQVVDKLKLNKEQKEQAQTIMDAAREEAAPLHESVARARLEIADALVNAKGDDAVKKAQDAYAAEVAKVTGLEAKTFAKIFALLKPNQQSRAPAAWDLMADIFNSPGRGGRGRGQNQN
jgi:Spy/CpxP family protein refolding chaperone